MGNTRGDTAATRTEAPAPVDGCCARGGSGLRADAARNRQRIVDAACELFGEHGLDVPLEDVAGTAGVGIATLYRRFPAREDLIAAVFEAMYSAYSAVIDQAVADPEPWAGLTRLVNGLCELQASNSALCDLVTMRFPSFPQMEQLQSTKQARLEELLNRCREAGQLRPDAEVTDLILIFLGNAEIVRRTGDYAPEAWRRYAALQLEGLRARPDNEQLPLSPPTKDIVTALKCSAR